MIVVVLCSLFLSVHAVVSFPASWTYQLSESDGTTNIWTAPSMRKVLKSDPSPTVSYSGVIVAAAKGEWESFQIVMAQGASPAITFPNFPTLDASQVVNMFRAYFIPGLGGGIHPEELKALDQGDALTTEAGGNTILFVDMYVPRTAVAGWHNNTLQFGSLTIPVSLWVFNFELPRSPVFRVQANTAIGSPADHSVAFDHNLMPKSTIWPSAMKYDISWTGTKAGPACTAIDDESSHEPNCAFQAKCLARKYVGGNWPENPRANGTGYPSWMLFQFVTNSRPRPTNFCGQTLDGGQFGAASCNDLTCLDSPYNQAWGAYLTALQTWVQNEGYADKAYIYVANEPPDSQAKLMAVLSRVHKKYSPNIKIAVSETPKAIIAEVMHHSECRVG